MKGWLSFLFTDLGEIRFKNHKFTTLSGHTSIISLTRDVIKLQNSTEDIELFPSHEIYMVSLSLYFGVVRKDKQIS